MAREYTDEEIQKALDGCASEPAHIPGTVQPFGAILGVDASNGIVTHASENVVDFLKRSANDIIGHDLISIIGKDAWHDYANALSRSQSSSQIITVGKIKVGKDTLRLATFRSGTHNILEFEPDVIDTSFSSSPIETLSALFEKIQHCETQQELFDTVTRLLKILTGYDRVLLYKFDAYFNGEILSEAKNPDIESFLGLRFPSYDIPSQARQIMEKLSTRFIYDVNQIQVPIITQSNNDPALDLTYAATRGVSLVHIEYLRNMPVQATCTLTLMVNGKLWGIVSFHHMAPKVPSLYLRQILSGFSSMLDLKLSSLIQELSLIHI